MNIWNFLTADRKINPIPLRQYFSRLRFKSEDGRVTNLQLRPLPKVHGGPRSDGAGPVLFAVADVGYFNRFANMFASSAAVNSALSAVHIHVLGTAEAPELNFDQMPRAFSMSFEPADFAPMSPAEKGRYCQCMRFVRLAEFVRQSGRDYLAFDIDGLFQKSFAEFEFDGDIGLIVRPEYSDPGLRVNAGVVYMKANSTAQKFMDSAASHMLRHVQHAPFIEKLDQRCLALAMDETVKALPTEIYTFQPGQGYFYSAKGKAKNQVLENVYQQVLTATE